MVPADERNLALICKRALEMDVPEMMASFITERENEPWEFHRDYSRQLWDEARHAMMGTVAFEARGIDWKRDIPLNVSFALRLNLHASALERQIMLYAIEQSLMPGETGKRFEHETAIAADDELSAHFHDSINTGGSATSGTGGRSSFAGFWGTTVPSPSATNWGRSRFSASESVLARPMPLAYRNSKHHAITHSHSHLLPVGMI